MIKKFIRYAVVVLITFVALAEEICIIDCIFSIEFIDMAMVVLSFVSVGLAFAWFVTTYALITWDR